LVTSASIAIAAPSVDLIAATTSSPLAAHMRPLERHASRRQEREQ
jgi:hypothetical protein